VVLDKHPDSINDGYFLNDADLAGLLYGATCRPPITVGLAASLLPMGIRKSTNGEAG
jgi:hypothetical protein